MLSKKIDLTDKYNYTLNGIEHQISLNSKISIQIEPLDEKLLISNKFLIKYIHDIFFSHNIEYFITYNTLMGYYVFEGIHLFKRDLYICIPDHHLNKLLKIKEQIIKDDFIFEEKEKENLYIIKTSFFDKIVVNCFIHIIKNDENKKLIHHIDQFESKLDFYDIYPLQEKKYEEFSIFIPNKIENVLNSFSFNLNSIVFNEKEKISLYNTNHKDKNKKNKIEKNIFSESLQSNESNSSNQFDFDFSFSNLLSFLKK